MIWKIRERELAITCAPLLMGIVNLTEDSFSDGGRFFQNGKLNVSLAVDHAMQLVDQGADILDLGAESSRPGAKPLGSGTELERLLPVVQELRKRTMVPISVDTYRADVAEAVLDAEADIINDITAGKFDARMLHVIKKTGAGYCLMHMQGTPDKMQDDPVYEDVVSEVDAFLRERLEACLDENVMPEQLVLDPGIGFGKTVAHNLELLQNISRFHQIGRPLLLGISRKRFLDALCNRDFSFHPEARLPGTIAATLGLVMQKVQIHRVHDVAALRQALTVFHFFPSIYHENNPSLYAS